MAESAESRECSSPAHSMELVRQVASNQSCSHTNPRRHHKIRTHKQ